MTKILYAVFFIALGLLCSCSQKETSDILSRIEGCIEVHPDSALLLLNQIPNSKHLYGRQCADYALLLAQARDKNFLDSLQSDSLIKLAVDYYQDSDDVVKAGKSLFYYGKVMALQDNDTTAMQAYLKAQTKLEKTKEYKLQAMIQEYIGVMNDDRNMHDVALNNYQKSVSYFQKAKDTLGIVYNYRNIAWIYDDKQNYDSAFWFLNSSLSLLKGDSTASIFPSLLHMLGIIQKRKGNYLSAINTLLTATEYENNPKAIINYYFSLGDAYIRINQSAKARECFEQGLISQDAFIKAGAYNYLYLLEKQNANYTKALYFKEISDSLLELDQSESLRSQILTIQSKYETEKLQMDKKLLKQEKRNQLYMVTSISSLLVVASILFYFWIKKQFKKIYRKRFKVQFEKTFETIKANEQIIGKYICQIEDLKKNEDAVLKTAERQVHSLNQRIHDLENKNEVSTKQQIAKLNQKIQILISENKAIREDSCTGGIYILEQLKKGQLIIENMTKKEKSLVFAYIDLLFGDFSSRLKEEYNLNENNLMLAILVKLNFTSAELMTVFQCEKNSIFKKKQRLRDKLYLRTDDELDKFLINYPMQLST